MTARNAFVGPQPFPADRRLYGRDRELLALSNRLLSERLILLYSPSGGGKTSLLMAEDGLACRMRDEDFIVLPTIRVSQAADVAARNKVNRYLLSALVALEAVREKGRGAEELAQVLAAAGAKLPDDFLDKHLHEIAPCTDRKQPLLIFDQFEEVVTLDPTDGEAKREFFRQLGQALRDADRWAIFAMREDYVATLDTYLPLLPTRLAATFRLDFLNKAAASDAARKPAAEPEFGVTFDDTAVTQLVNELARVNVQDPITAKSEPREGPYVEPLFLQVVCQRLWTAKNPAKGDHITVEDLGLLTDRHSNELRGVDAALAGYYSDAIADVAKQFASSSITERLLRIWFDRALISPAGLRLSVLLGTEADYGLNPAVLRALADRYLVRQEPRHGGIYYELAHDRLSRPIQKNNTAWRQDSLSEFQRRAEYWKENSRRPDLLVEGKELEDGEQQAVHDKWSPDSTDALYLAECVKVRQAKINRDNDRRSRRRVRAWVAGAIAVIVVGIAFVAIDHYLGEVNKRKEREKRAEALQLLSYAGNLTEPMRQAEWSLEGTPNESVRLSLLALREINKTEKELYNRFSDQSDILPNVEEQISDIRRKGEETLRKTLGAIGGIGLPANVGQVKKIAILEASTDGKNTPVPTDKKTKDALRWVAAAGEKERRTLVALWDFEDADAPKQTMHECPSPIFDLQITADGGFLIASSGNPHVVTLWDLKNRLKAPYSIEVKSQTLDRYQPFYVSPNGKWLEVDDKSKNGMFVDLRTGVPKVSEFQLPAKYSLRNFSFSKHDNWFARITDDGEVLMWDLRKELPSAAKALKGGGGLRQVINGEFQQADDRLLVFSTTLKARSWVLDKHTDEWNPVPDVVLADLSTKTREEMSEDATLITNRQGTLSVLVPRSDSQAKYKVTKTDRAAFVFFGDKLSADGGRRVTSDNWNRVSSYFESDDSHNWLAGQLFDADLGKTTLAVWNLNNGSIQRTLPDVAGFHFIPKTQWLVAHGDDNIVRLLDLSTDKPYSLRGHNAQVRTIVSSKNGRWLVTGADDGTVRAWGLSPLAVTSDFYPFPSTEIAKSLLVTPDHRWLVVSPSDGSVRFWPIDKGSLNREDRFHAEDHRHQGPATLIVSKCGRHLLEYHRNSTGPMLWDLKQEKPVALRRLDTKNERATALWADRNGDWIAVQTASQVLVWNVAALKKDSLTPRSLPGKFVGFFVGKNEVLIQDGNVILPYSLVESLPPGQPTYKLSKAGRSIVYADMSSKDWLVVSHKANISNNNTVETEILEVGRSTKPQQIGGFFPDEGPFFSGNGNYLCTRFSKIQNPWDRNTLRYWHMPSLTQGSFRKVETNTAVRLVDLSRDNQWLLTEEDKQLFLWDLQKAPEVILPESRRKLAPQDIQGSTAAFSADSRWLVTRNGGELLVQELCYLSNGGHTAPQESKTRLKDPLRIKSKYNGDVKKVAVQQMKRGKAESNYYRVAVARQEGSVLYWTVAEKSPGSVDVPFTVWPSGTSGIPDQMLFTTDGAKLLSFYPDGIRVSVSSAKDLKKQAQRVLGSAPNTSKAIWEGDDKVDPLVLKKNDTLAGVPPFDALRKPSLDYEIPMKEGQVYAISMNSIEIDSYLLLFNPAGKEVARDDDGGGNLNARILYTCPKEGIYKITATVFANTRAGAFDLEVRRFAPTTAVLGDKSRGKYSSQLGDEDLTFSDNTGPEKKFEINLSSGQSLKLAVDGAAFQSIIRVENPAGKLIGLSEPSSNNPAFTFRAAQSGAYRIHVIGISGRPGPFDLAYERLK